MAKPKKSLRKQYKREILIDDVVAKVARGELKVDERILPVRDLCDHYGVSMRVILEGVKEMVDRGILVRRPRRGYFISAGAPDLCRAEIARQEERSSETDSGRLPASDAVLPHFLSVLNESRRISLYITDVHPQRLAVWQRLIDEFSQEHDGVSVELLTCADGHVEQILQERDVDVIDAERQILNRYRDRLTEFSSTSLVGLKEKDLLPVIQRWVKTRKGIMGIPRALTTTYLYVNEDLLEGNIPSSIAGLYQASQAFEAAHDDGLSGIIPERLFIPLCQSGALTLKAGEWAVNERQLKEFLSVYTSEMRGLSCVGATQGIDLFLAGRALFLPHCSYLAPSLAESKGVNWKAHPMPVAKSGCLYGKMLSLGMNQKTEHSDLCLALIGKLSSLDAQIAFGRFHGNLPALTKAAWHPEVLADHPIDEAVLRKAVDQSELVFPGENEGQQMEQEIGSLGAQLTLHDTISIDDAVTRIRFFIDRANQSRHASPLRR
ncbi:MAG: hypothetical protein ACYTGH_10755 [Planctomycetota bacterium]|jgi:ABC-type glycerol-3-phosphate transport system substrate-binding protein